MEHAIPLRARSARRRSGRRISRLGQPQTATKSRQRAATRAASDVASDATKDRPGNASRRPDLALLTSEGAIDGDRNEAARGYLSKDASFWLIVSGNIGIKEIERLIKKLEFDKEILADEGEETAGSDAP